MSFEEKYWTLAAQVLELKHELKIQDDANDILEADNKLMRDTLIDIAKLDTSKDISSMWLINWRNYTKQLAQETLSKISHKKTDRGDE